MAAIAGCLFFITIIVVIVWDWRRAHAPVDPLLLARQERRALVLRVIESYFAGEDYTALVCHLSLVEQRKIESDLQILATSWAHVVAERQAHIPQTPWML